MSVGPALSKSETVIRKKVRMSNVTYDRDLATYGTWWLDQLS